MESYKASIDEYSNESRIQRLQSLYSDWSRLRLTNERGYTANLEWWKGALMGGLDAVNPSTLSLTFDTSFVRSWHHPRLGLPKALGVVISALVSDGVLLPLSEYLNGTSNTHTQPSSSLLNAPLEWLFASLGLGGEDSASRDDGDQAYEKAKGSYVIASRTRSLASTVVDQHALESLTRRLYTRKLFALRYSLSHSDADLLIKWLCNEGSAVCTHEGVKIVDRSSQPHQHTLTTVDKGVIGMVAALHSISAQIDELEVEIKSRTDTIANHIKQRETTHAKRVLRSRKALQDLLHKRLDTRESLQGVLLKIEQSVGDIEIMQAYETSNDTLKAILKAPELDRDRVDNTMDTLADTLADHAEIDNAIARPGAAGVSGEMEQEIEDEYERLLGEQEGEKKEEQKKVEEEEGVEGKKQLQTQEDTQQSTQDAASLPTLPTPPSTEPAVDKVAETM